MGKYVESEFISREIIVDISTEVCKRRNMISPENIEAVASGMEIVKIFLESKFKQKTVTINTRVNLSKDIGFLFVEFNSFSDAINAMDCQLDWQYFTIGKGGRKPYHFWTVGRCGCYYAYRCMPSGNSGFKRQIEEKTLIRVFIKNTKK